MYRNLTRDVNLKLGVLLPRIDCRACRRSSTVAAATIIRLQQRLRGPPPLQAHTCRDKLPDNIIQEPRPRRSTECGDAARDRGDARDEILRHRRLLLQRPVEEPGTGVDHQQRPLRHRAPPDPPRGRSRRGQLEGALRQDRTERRHVQEPDQRC
jgi:hypothetical protein